MRAEELHHVVDSEPRRISSHDIPVFLWKDYSVERGHVLFRAWWSDAAADHLQGEDTIEDGDRITFPPRIRPVS
jgi:hypothetical protein